MTNNMRDSFEAWASTQGLELEYGAKEAARLGWQAATAKLRNAVIVLEDGVMPEAGDVVIAETENLLEDGRLDFTSISAEYFVRKDLHPFKVKKIIQRQGKPVIYESEIV